MKVVALVSGGKDSTYNMMQCVKAGHEIVCLANLHPPPETGELDSYMYQSVGAEAMEQYARCMQLPLLRGQIRGTPVNTDYDYSPEEEDEVEDLHKLLAKVKEAFPDVEGVSSGAIWSSYQKNRVENICTRLGMTSLAYLWERDQPTLLRDMISDSIQAVLIKVAVAGLDARHLGKTLQEMEPILLALKDNLGINVCGEGGEYESLTLDCPLFRRERLEVVESEQVVHRNTLFAPVVYLKIKSIRRVPKSQ